MLLIPAIDLKDGRCVRLRQGDLDDATVFSEDPSAMAMHWLDRGDNIRSVSHYQRLMEPYFRIERSSTMVSGVCDLVVYVLRRNEMA